MKNAARDPAAEDVAAREALERAEAELGRPQSHQDMEEFDSKRGTLKKVAVRGAEPAKDGVNKLRKTGDEAHEELTRVNSARTLTAIVVTLAGLSAAALLIALKRRP